MKNKLTFFMLASFLTLLTIAPIMAHSGEDQYGHHSMMSGYWGGINSMWIFGCIFMILGTIALVVFIVWMIKQTQQPMKK